MEGLDSRDRALATRLVLGTIGAAGFLDECVLGHVRHGAKLEPKVLDALRLAAYEILFLDTPSYVVVNEGVELVRSARPRAAGMANAVLRRIDQEDLPRRRAALRKAREERECSLEELALVSGYPAWLLERMGEARDIALSATEAAPLYVAQNAALYDLAQTKSLLQKAGLAPVEQDVPGSYMLKNPGMLSASGLVESASIIPADVSAQRVASHVPLERGARVLEVGQGRGTKSILLESNALRSGFKVRIEGIDSMGFKARVASNRMQCAGLSDVVTCHEFDGRMLDSPKLPKPLDDLFDVVFVDAPCSGTGTMRRHPEIPWTIEPQDIDELKHTQLAILRAAAARVRKGGFLCYATCSVLREENDDVVRSFLAAKLGSSFAWESEPIRTFPALDGPDGHFAALLRRIA